MVQTSLGGVGCTALGIVAARVPSRWCWSIGAWSSIHLVGAGNGIVTLLATLEIDHL